jgi:hypothetical protein
MLFLLILFHRYDSIIFFQDSQEELNEIGTYTDGYEQPVVREAGTR